jgi:hypothetical protein
MKYNIGDLFVYEDSHTPATLLLLTKIEHETLHLEFSDQEGVTAIGKYRIDLIEKNYLKNGCWKYYPVIRPE